MSDMTLTRADTRLALFFAQMKRTAVATRRRARRKIEERTPQTPEEFKYSLHVWMLRAGFACTLLGILGKFLRPSDPFWEKLIEWSLIFMAGKFTNHVGTSLVQNKPERKEPPDAS